MDHEFQGVKHLISGLSKTQTSQETNNVIGLCTLTDITVRQKGNAFHAVSCKHSDPFGARNRTYAGTLLRSAQITSTIWRHIEKMHFHYVLMSVTVKCQS